MVPLVPVKPKEEAFRNVYAVLEHEDSSVLSVKSDTGTPGAPFKLLLQCSWFLLSPEGKCDQPCKKKARPLS